jgi:hypothetical protein
MYFLTESLSGIITLSTTWIAVRLFVLQGLGIGFIVANVLYCCVVWIVLRRELPLKWTAYNRNLLLASLAAAFTIRLLPITPLAHFRTLIALILTGAFGAYSVRALWSEYQEDRVHNSTSRPTTSLPTANLPVVTGSEAEV